jgi:hypothetical protein
MDISLFEPDDVKNIPTFRAAYSDRTALLMAKLAFRAYNDFDGSEAAFKTFRTDSSNAAAWSTGMSARQAISSKATISSSSYFAEPRTSWTGRRT